MQPYHRWQLDGGNGLGGIFRFEAECGDTARDRERALKALAAGLGTKFPCRDHTSPAPNLVVAGEPCVTPLTPAVIENARAMVVAGRPLTREQFEAVGAVAYEEIAARPRIARYLREADTVHGTRSALGRAWVDVVERLAFLDVLRADVPLDVALAAYPPGRIAFDNFDGLLKWLSTWAKHDLQEARRAAKRDRRDRAEASRILIDADAAVDDDDAEIARLSRLLPGVNEWLSGQRADLQRRIAALDLLPPAKPWALPIMPKGSDERNAWLRRRREVAAAKKRGTRMAYSETMPTTEADWQRNAVDDAIGDLLADEQTVVRLHDRLATLKSIRRWNDRITPSAHRIKHFGEGARPRLIRLKREERIASPGPRPRRHWGWPRLTVRSAPWRPFGDDHPGWTTSRETYSPPLPDDATLDRALTAQRAPVETLPPAEGTLTSRRADVCGFDGWSVGRLADWGWRPGDWPAPKLVDGPWIPYIGPCRQLQAGYLKVGDTAIPPAGARVCCHLWLDKKEHDTACNERRWRRSYF